MVLFFQIRGLFDGEQGREPGENVSDKAVIWKLAARSIFQAEHHDGDVGVGALL